MSDFDTNDVPAEQLSRLLDLSEQSGFWREEELGDILAHQLAAPLTTDLAAVEPKIPQPTETASAGSAPKTFGDLLTGDERPFELLHAAKRFAKQASRDGSLPRDVAAVLYLTAIAAAWIEHGQRITSLDDQSLLTKLAWAIGLPWIDPAVRKVLDEAFQTVGM